MLYNMAQYDIGIVLGHEMDMYGVPDAETRARLEKVARLYASGLIARIMVMGWAYRDDSNISLAQGMKNHLIASHNIPEDAVTANEASRDTVGDAFFSRQIYDTDWAQNRGNNQSQKHTIAVITSDYHVARTEIIFKFIYGDAYHIDIIGTIEGETDEKRLQAERASLTAFYETFKQAKKGDLQSISDALYRLHPLYRE